MTPTEFCQIEDFDAMTLKHLKKICQHFYESGATHDYFVGYSYRKDKYRLVSFLEQVQKKMRIDRGE